MKKRLTISIVIFLAGLIAYLSISTNRDSLLYKEFSLRVTVTNGSPYLIRIDQRQGNALVDVSQHFRKVDVDKSTLIYKSDVIPAKELTLKATNSSTRIGRVIYSIEGSPQETLLPEHHLGRDMHSFAPVLRAMNAYNYRGNLFFAGVFLPRFLEGILAISLIIFLLRRYFFNFYVWLFVPLLAVKLFYGYRLELLGYPDFPLVLIGAFFAEAATWLVLVYLSTYSRNLILSVLIQVVMIFYLLNYEISFIHFHYTNEPLILDNLRFLDTTSVVSVTSLTIFVLCALLLVSISVFYVGLFRAARSRRDFIQRNHTLELMILGIILYVAGSFAYQPRQLNGVEQSDFSLYATHKNYRQIVTPSMVNTFHELYKLFFPDRHLRQPLSQQDKALLTDLGVMGHHGITTFKHPPKRIILISVESLSSCLVHYYNDGVPARVTPGLDSLLSRYPHLDNYFTARTPTLYGMMATQTSNLRMENVLDGAYLTLPKLLDSHRFLTTFIQGCDRNYAQYNYYFDRFGFKSQITKETLETLYPDSRQNFGWGFCDAVLLDEVVSRLKLGGGKPQYLSVLTIDMHMPGGRVNPDLDLSPIRDLTNTLFMSIYSTDQAISSFVKKLEAANQLNSDTLVMITADHSSPIHDNYLKIPGVERSSLARIPLIFITTNQELLVRLTQLQKTYASQIDLAPTILAMQGITPPASMMGRNLFASNRNFALIYRDDTLEYLTPERKLAVLTSARYPAGMQEHALHRWLWGD